MHATPDHPNNMPPHITKDLAVAAIPTTATITLSQVNQLFGIIGGALGIAYLIWKWNKEAKNNSHE